MGQKHLAVLTGDRKQGQTRSFFTRKCMAVLPGGVDPSKSSNFLKLSTDKVVLVFKCSQAQVSFFKNSYKICCVYVTMAPHYLHFDFKLTSDAKISHIFNSAIYLISVIVEK